jgi:cytochrome o ubiquinol oxidase operon protein cyoD
MSVVQKARAHISYIVGLALSAMLTLEAYLLVVHKALNPTMLMGTLLGLALIQMVVQLTFFLHIGQETKPRWNLVFLLSTAGIVFIVVAGSIWIMYHLNYLMMPSEMNNYLMQQEAIYK